MIVLVEGGGSCVCFVYWLTLGVDLSCGGGGGQVYVLCNGRHLVLTGCDRSRGRGELCMFCHLVDSWC